jgi:hypothetical protein
MTSSSFFKSSIAILVLEPTVEPDNNTILYRRLKSIYQNRRGVIMNIVLLSGSTVGSKTRIAMDTIIQYS